jgi:hypothetical protein
VVVRLPSRDDLPVGEIEVRLRAERDDQLDGTGKHWALDTRGDLLSGRRRGTCS